MKRKLLVLVAVVIVLSAVLPSVGASAEAVPVEVYLGGTHISVDLVQDGLVVMGFADITTESGVVCPARAAGMEIGDVLRQIDGVTTRTRYDVQRALTASDGRAVTLSVVRGDRDLTLLALPVWQPQEGYLLGVYLKDGVEGVGTLTYVRCDTHAFAALGHAIEDPDTGVPATLYRGKAYTTRITDIVKGRVGEAGELRGTLREGEPIGEVTANTTLGIFGIAEPAMYEGLERVRVASRDEVREGAAVIVCALDNERPKYYAVQITRCQVQTTPRPKGISLKVTDTRLLDKTGGIVQGMSGSPILQDGRLVGAVTHVMIDDPTEGYGVYIDFMLGEG